MTKENKFIECHEFCHDYTQKDQSYVVAGFIKYEASDHFTRLSLGREQDEADNKYLQRMFKIAVDAIQELKVSVYKKAEGTQKEDYKKTKEKPMMIVDSSDDLLRYGFCGVILNSFINDYAGGASLGNG